MMKSEMTDTSPDVRPPADKPTLSEAAFQGLLDALLILLYMTAVMVFMSQSLEQPLPMSIWAIQGLAFAVFFGWLRAAWMLSASKKVERRKLQRGRWWLFVMSGVVVATACAVQWALRHSTSGSVVGLGLAGAVMAVAGAIGFWRE